MLFLYRTLINLTLLVSPLIIILRLFKKKEHPVRFFEKFAISSKKRVSGKLIWFHGSSVGEILSIIPLIEKLEKNKNISQILITSSTLSSSKVLERLKLKKTVHQFFPIDSDILINKFLDYWKPSSAFFVESEIWPNTIINLKNRNVKLILINGRITKKTFRKWKKIKNFAKLLFGKFDLSLSQNNETEFYLKKLGAKKIKNVGNLKFSESKLIKKHKFSKKNYKFLIKKKVIFGAISTHFNEEYFCGKIHLELKKKYKESISIIIPRHVDRSVEIKNDLEKIGLKVYLHSSENKPEKNIDIYLVDTYGETNLFLNICKIVFLGGSIIKRGGQNPLEAARAGCKVIHGANIDNFKEVYTLLNTTNISSKIKNINDAKSIIIKNLSNKFKSKKNIIKLNLIGKKILLNNQKEIINFL